MKQRWLMMAVLCAWTAPAQTPQTWTAAQDHADMNGVPEKGDAKWLDRQGSFMATVAAGPVFRLLGAKDLGVGDDYLRAKMPAVNEGLLTGRLAWRQHDGGHTDGPNWRYFIPWADRELAH